MSGWNESSPGGLTRISFRSRVNLNSRLHAVEATFIGNILNPNNIYQTLMMSVFSDSSVNTESMADYRLGPDFRWNRFSRTRAMFNAHFNNTAVYEHERLLLSVSKWRINSIFWWKQRTQNHLLVALHGGNQTYYMNIFSKGESYTIAYIQLNFHYNILFGCTRARPPRTELTFSVSAPFCPTCAIVYRES